MFRTAVATLAAAVIGATSVTDCKWSQGKLRVTWAAPKKESADYYEVQVANEAGGSLFAVYSTEETQAELGFLTANKSFWLKVRAHKAGAPSLGPGTWLKPGSEIECKTGSGLATRVGAAASAKTRLLEVLRQSEYVEEVDYLTNHDSGDIVGDTAFTVFTGGQFSGDFTTSVFTLYCLEVLDVRVPDTITTDGDDRFADYLSCNNNHDHSDPQCTCSALADRRIADWKEQTKHCTSSFGGPCTLWDCTCHCSDASLAASAKYVGMMPVYFSQPERLGDWYSHPKATECRESEAVGTSRADGTMCTWKRHPEARVVRGSDLLDFGWNTTRSRLAAVVHQNAAIFRGLFDSQPYQKWTCPTPTPTPTPSPTPSPTPPSPTPPSPTPPPSDCPGGTLSACILLCPVDAKYTACVQDCVKQCPPAGSIAI